MPPSRTDLEFERMLSRRKAARGVLPSVSAVAPRPLPKTATVERPPVSIPLCTGGQPIPDQSEERCR